MGDGNDEQASRATLKKLQTAAVGFCWVAVFFCVVIYWFMPGELIVRTNLCNQKQ